MPAASTLLTGRAFASLVAAATLLTLAACVDAPEQPVPPTPTTAPTATAEPEPTPTSGAQPLDIECAELVDPDTMYSFDPNYALVGSFDPQPGSLAADQVAAGGVTCQWVRESGGGTIDLSVAAFTEEQITELKNEAFAESEMVPTYGDEAYFEVEGDVGTAIVFQGRFRLVVSSAAFFEPGEPTAIIESALAAL
jgi:predicted small lipoprotein YifL